MKYKERTYRKRVNARDLVSFQVVVRETDLWVSAERPLGSETRERVLNFRYQLESYIHTHQNFLTTLEPYPEDPYAPPIVRGMIRATGGLGIGPMASVAGAMAQYVGKDLLELTEQVIVENGGDIYMKAGRPLNVSIFAGKSPLSERIGLKISVEQMPLGVCSSSGTVGHSHSAGIADAVCIVSPSCTLADGAATALGNKVRKKKDLESVSRWAMEIEGITGGVVILGDGMATWGDIELVGL